MDCDAADTSLYLIPSHVERVHKLNDYSFLNGAQSQKELAAALTSLERLWWGLVTLSRSLLELNELECVLGHHFLHSFVFSVWMFVENVVCFLLFWKSPDELRTPLYYGLKVN